MLLQKKPSFLLPQDTNSSSSSSSSPLGKLTANLRGITKTVISSVDAIPPFASFHLNCPTCSPRAAATSS